jgi:tetratricopeptide (TPR) repeat protein
MTQQPDDAKQQSESQSPAEEEGEQLVLTSPEEVSTTRDFILWAGVIVLAALTIYAPALHGKFLWDDDRHVEANRNLRDLPGLVNIWTKFGIRGGGTVQYYPLTHTTFWLEYQLTGARPGEINPLVFHITNVVLHAASAILLWLVLRELKVPGAWLAAAIWALHPIQVESVAWISERKNVLAGVFFFGSILAFLLSSFGPRRERPGDFTDRLYWISFALFVCAVLSKTIACSMPAVVLLLVWWKRGRLTSRDFLATAPFFLVGLIMAGVTSWMERTHVGAAGADWNLSIPQRILIAGRAVWFYVTKLIWPTKLTFIYPRWDVQIGQAWQWIFPIAVVAVTAILFALRNRIGRGAIVAWLIFCGTLVPALGFFNVYPMRYSFVADHFQYLAGPALIALIVGAATTLLRRSNATKTAAPYVIAGILLVVLSTLTLMQSRVYADPIALWGDAVRKNPSSPMLNYNYALTLLIQSDELPPEDAAKVVDNSLPYFEQATKLNPQHDRAFVGWGNALVLRGKFEDAIAKFDRASAINPRSLEAMIGRGRALFELGRLDDSLAAYQTALAEAEAQRGTGAVSRIKAATIHQYLGKIFQAKNDLDSAAKHFAEAAAIADDSSIMHYDYGQLLAKTGKKVEAAQQFAEAIRIRPDFLDARIALARLMIEVGNLPGAQNQLVAAARIDSNYPPLMEAAKEFDAKMRERETAATRPSTTQSATQPETQSTQPSTRSAAPQPSTRP